MKRNKFNLSYTKLFSCDLGELIPVGLTEVLPGDTFRMSTSALVRTQPLLAPVMHPVEVRIHHWFVPHRLVWSSWEPFITGGPDGLDASTFPTIAMVPTEGTLADYYGVPPAPAGMLFSALPFRGYGLIWNEYYRDQDLQTALTVSLGSGADNTTNRNLQNVAWEKDYFTSARPWEQKGASVNIPLLGTAPVVFGQTPGTPSVVTLDRASAAADANVRVNETDTGGPSAIIANANLAAASGVTVNALRQSLAIQRYQEARAMYGSRYPEYLRALGVKSSDGRLQRPEYLGGGKQVIQFSEVLQQAADGANPVGTLRGHGVAALRSNYFQRFFEEHGYVHTFMSVKPKTIYGNGLFRHWNKTTKFDFWQKELEHLGQQAIQRKEIYISSSDPTNVFGYQDRYDEYRRSESLIAGEFRSTTLNYWHFARIFGSEPTLNSTFVSAVPTERVFPTPAQDVLYIHARNNIKARRLVSARANPRTF